MTTSTGPSTTAALTLTPSNDAGQHTGEAAPPPSSSPASATAPAAASRIAGIDLARIGVALLVVWFHSAQTPLFMRFGHVANIATPFYSTLAGIFLALSFRKLMAKRRGDAHAAGDSLAVYMRKRAVRLYLPYLGWSVIYLILAAGGLDPFPPERPFLSLKWLYTPSEDPLWFLIHLVAMTIIFTPFVYLVMGNRRLEKGLAYASLLGALIIATVPWPAMYNYEYGWLVEHSWGRIPTFLVGMSIGLFLPGTRFNLGWSTIQCGLMATLMFAIGVLSYFNQWMVWLVSFGAFTLLMVAAAPAWSRLAGPRIAALGALSYGVYLTHVMFINLAWVYMDQAHITPTITTDLIVTASAFTGAVLLTIALRRFSFTTWLAP